MSRTLMEYFASLQEKTVAVVGIGISNTPLIRRLRQAGIAVTACDKKSEAQLGALAQELKELGVTLRLGEGYLEGLCEDVIFRSPGIRPDIAPFVQAVEQGSVLTSEMEVFFEVCPCPIIAVTGSDGKTTTTTLIAQVLKAAGKCEHIGGNIGNPLLVESETMAEEDWVVLELSSFQLMTLKQSPQIAVVTNISPDHLDIHTSMDEYRQAKTAIYAHQSPENRVVFNWDNEETRILSQEAKGKVTLFSRVNPEADVFVQEGMIYYREKGESMPLFACSDILIPGTHNVENYLAAIGALWGLVPVAAMKETAQNFPGVEHRIERVRVLDGVTYYNDSIASSPTRTIAGLHSFAQKVILIAGGYDKKIPFDELGVEICKHVKALVLVGHTAAKIQNAVLVGDKAVGDCPPITVVNTMADAVQKAREQAGEGDVVILSPACASFDLFDNVAQRGRTFKEFVNQR